jgi:hypothetical protein
VRGFLAGAVRKKLGLTPDSEKTDGERAYRVGEAAVTHFSRDVSAGPSTYYASFETLTDEHQNMLSSRNE